MSEKGKHPVVPDELPKLLHSLSYAVLKNKPQDIIQFAAEHFQQLYDEREQDKDVSSDKAEFANDVEETDGDEENNGKNDNSEDEAQKKPNEENESVENDI